MEPTAQPTIVGIDVSKDRLDVAILPHGEAFFVTRDAAGIDALATRLLPLAPAAVALEATGGYESIVAASLGGAGLPVLVLNPAQIRAFAKAVGQRAKTDPIDARLIATFVLATNPPIRPLPDEAMRRLNDLVARRRQIIAMMVAERQRLKRFPEPRLQRSITRLLDALQRELSELDTEIGRDIRARPAWRENEELASSVPGVGPIIARTLIAELREIGQLSRRQIAALAGLAPWTRQSGKWKGMCFIGGGRAPVRAALHMGAVTAIRYNPALKAFYERLLAAGKPKMLALVAVARKLLTIINAIIRDRSPWQPLRA